MLLISVQHTASFSVPFSQDSPDYKIIVLIYNSSVQIAKLYTYFFLTISIHNRFNKISDIFPEILKIRFTLKKNLEKSNLHNIKTFHLTLWLQFKVKYMHNLKIACDTDKVCINQLLYIHILVKKIDSAIFPQ